MNKIKNENNFLDLGCGNRRKEGCLGLDRIRGEETRDFAPPKRDRCDISGSLSKEKLAAS